MQKSGPSPEQAETNERNETIVSASKEHKKELELERQRQREEQAKAERKSMKLYGVVGAVCAVVAVAVLVINSGILQRSVAAVTVNGTKFTTADMQYYYNMQYQNAVKMSQSYALYGIDYGFDYTKDPAEQVYNTETGQTWEEFFLDSAKQSVTYLTAVNDAAEAAGHTLSDKALESREEVLRDLDTVWVGGYNNRDQFLRATYGSYMTYDHFVKLLDKELMAADYVDSITGEMEYDEADYDAYYAEHADDLDTFTFTQFVLQAKEPVAAEGQTLTAEEKTAGLEKEKAEKKAVAEDILAKLNAGADPEELAKEYKDDLYSSAVSTTRVGTSMQATVFADWALDSGRKNGDTTLAEYQGGTVYNYYVVRFEGRALDESNTADVRHMLIAAETNDAVSVPTEEQFAAAEAKAQEVLDLWKKGEATEESFAALVPEYTADAGSAATGGLIEKVNIGDNFIPEFTNWALDPARQPGDTGLVKNTGSSVMGWHVMYYVGDNMPVWQLVADSALLEAEYAAWETEVMKGYEAQDGFGLKLM